MRVSKKKSTSSRKVSRKKSSGRKSSKKVSPKLRSSTKKTSSRLPKKVSSTKKSVSPSDFFIESWYTPRDVTEIKRIVSTPPPKLCLPRWMEDCPDYHGITYKPPDATSLGAITNLHLGQRKLALSEVSCLLEFCKGDVNRKMMVVYAGAAPGQHLGFILGLFPNAIVHAVDPAPFDIHTTPSERKRVYVRQEFFTDSVAKEYSEGPKIKRCEGGCVYPSSSAAPRRSSKKSSSKASVKKTSSRKSSRKTSSKTSVKKTSLRRSSKASSKNISPPKMCTCRTKTAMEGKPVCKVCRSMCVCVVCGHAPRCDIFISDVRLGVETGKNRWNPEFEKQVEEDMRAQERWTRIISPKSGAMLKFRLPYPDENATVSYNYEYLSGRILVQTWPTTSSTEGRLVVKRKLGSNPYPSKNYDAARYQDWFAYHNTIRRGWAFFGIPKECAKVPGYDGCFDCANEAETWKMLCLFSGRPIRDVGVLMNNLTRHIHQHLDMPKGSLHGYDKRPMYQKRGELWQLRNKIKAKGRYAAGASRKFSRAKKQE